MNFHDAWLAGAAVWPDLQCQLPTFQTLAARAWAQNPQTLNVGDLYLAAAIVEGRAVAVEAFDRAFVGPNAKVLQRLGLSAENAEDALQIVREKLLVSHDDGELRVASLAGTGNFAAIVRVVAIRTGLDLKRKYRHSVNEDSELIDELASPHSPHGAIMRSQSRELFKQALRSAINELTPREKTLLRMHLFHQITIDDLAGVYDVHRATAARWLGRVHDRLEKLIRQNLVAQLGEGETPSQIFAEAQNSLHQGFSSVWAELKTEAAHLPLA